MFLENMSIDVTRFGEPSFLLFHYHSDVLHSFSVHALIFITLYEKVWFKKLVPTIYTTVCFSFFYVWCIDVSLQFLHLWWIPSVMLCNITVLLYLRLLTSLADDFFNIFNWLKWFFNWIFVCEIINVLRKRPFFIWKLYMHIFGNFLTIWSSKPPLLSLTISSTF